MNRVPGDVYLSVAAKQMADLEKKDLIITATRKDLLGNQLVLIVSLNSTLGLTSFNDLTKDEVEKFAMGATGNGSCRPVWGRGNEDLGIWDRVKERAVQTKY